MTAFYYFTGPCKWARVYEPDDFNGEKKWKIDVFLSKADLKELKDTGCKLRPKEDDDGNKFVTFNRPCFKEIKGELKEFDPPKVLAADSKTPFTEIIGNGSTVTVKISVYDTKMGPGHRLEAVRVDQHVPYAKPVEGQEGEF